MKSGVQGKGKESLAIIFGNYKVVQACLGNNLEFRAYLKSIKQFVLEWTTVHCELHTSSSCYHWDGNFKPPPPHKKSTVHYTTLLPNSLVLSYIFLISKNNNKKIGGGGYRITISFRISCLF